TVRSHVPASVVWSPPFAYEGFAPLASNVIAQSQIPYDPQSSFSVIGSTMSNDTSYVRSIVPISGRQLGSVSESASASESVSLSLSESLSVSLSESLSASVSPPTHTLLPMHPLSLQSKKPSRSSSAPLSHSPA